MYASLHTWNYHWNEMFRSPVNPMLQSIRRHHGGWKFVLSNIWDNATDVHGAPSYDLLSLCKYGFSSILVQVCTTGEMENKWYLKQLHLVEAGAGRLKQYSYDSTSYTDHIVRHGISDMFRIRNYFWSIKIGLIGQSLMSHEHASSYMRRQCEGHLMGCLWPLLLKPNTGSD